MTSVYTNIELLLILFHFYKDYFSIILITFIILLHSNHYIFNYACKLLYVFFVLVILLLLFNLNSISNCLSIFELVHNTLFSVWTRSKNVRGDTTTKATAPQLHSEMCVCIIALHRMVNGLCYLPNGQEAMMYFVSVRWDRIRYVCLLYIELYGCIVSKANTRAKLKRATVGYPIALLG